MFDNVIILEIANKWENYASEVIQVRPNWLVLVRGVHGSGQVGFVPDPEPTRISRVG